MVEQHSAMRFAWIRNKEGSEESVMSPAARAIFILYNVVWWLPIFLVVVSLWSYRAGALGFVIVTVVRATANLYRVNVLPVEEGQRFPFRAP